MRAVAEGSAVITATTADGGLTATCVVTVETVEAETIAVSGVSLDKTTDSITVGEADRQLTATVSPENATNKEVTWTSDNEAAATVDQAAWYCSRRRHSRHHGKLR